MRDTVAAGIAGTIVGAGIAFALEPTRRRRRWALVRDQVVHVRRKTRAAANATARDMTNRARGVWAEARAAFEPGTAPDAVIAERVRAKLGRWCSHPRAVDVEAQDGCITLRGPILASERTTVVSAVRRVRGVRDVEDRFEAHEPSDEVSALRGGTRRRGERFAFLQTRWSPTARVVVGALGTGFVVRAVARRSMGAGLLVALGLLGIARAITNGDPRRLLGSASVPDGDPRRGGARCDSPALRAPSRPSIARRSCAVAP